MIPPHPLVVQTWWDWAQFAGLYLLVTAAVALARGAWRGWRGPSNRDLSDAVATMAKWMQRTNARMERENRGRVVHMTVSATGAMSSVLAPPERGKP